MTDHLIEHETVYEAPPSVKLVYLALRFMGPMTNQDLVDETGLSRPTVREALDDLQEWGIVDKTLSPDARQNQYFIPPSGDSG